jgi:hypothetical protein
MDGCPTGKKLWRSKTQAKRAVKHARAQQRSQREHDVAVCSIYECRRCGGWHMSKQAPRSNGRLVA